MKFQKTHIQPLRDVCFYMQYENNPTNSFRDISGIKARMNSRKARHGDALTID